MIKTMHVSSPRNRFQNILNQRDIINAIQQCPQIIKQDKLFIRTKVKDFYKQFQPQTPIQPQITQLLQIFNQCRKPLSKIHLYQNHSHWLQVKLRRYIASQRKKQKEQSLQQFRKEKCEDKAKKIHMMQKRIRNQELFLKQESRRYFHGSVNDSKSRSKLSRHHNSHQNRKLQSPTNLCHTSRFNQTSRFRRLPQSQHQNNILGTKRQGMPQTCKSTSNQRFKQGLALQFDNKVKYNRSITTKNLPKAQTQKRLSNKSTYEKFKKIQKKQKNKQQQKQNQQNNRFWGANKKRQQQQQFFASNNSSKKQLNPGRDLNINSYNNINANLNTNVNNWKNGHSHLHGHELKKNISRQRDISLQSYEYQQYRSKMGSLIKYEQLSSIKEVREYHNDSARQTELISNFGDSSRNQHLYTSPQLLEECRKFIQKSEYNQNYNHSLPQPNNNLFNASQNNHQYIQGNMHTYQNSNKQHKTNIIDNLYDLKSQQMRPYQQQQEYQHQIYQKQNKQDYNIFDQIECVQYHSPQFRIEKQQEVEKFVNVKDLLKHIFQRDWKVYLSELDQQEIIQRTPIDLEDTTRFILSQVDKKTRFISFVDLYANFNKLINISFSFSNIFLLLDVDSKGLIAKTDYQFFMQNFTSCPIQTQILTTLKQKLQTFQKVVEQTFAGCQIVPGCFEYLELIQHPAIFQLGEILQMFQFQIDGDSNTFNNEGAD